MEGQSLLLGGGGVITVLWSLDKWKQVIRSGWRHQQGIHRTTHTYVNGEAMR